jgi:hypothetical protein
MRYGNGLKAARAYTRAAENAREAGSFLGWMKEGWVG